MHRLKSVANKLPPTIIVSQQLAAHVISYRQIAAEKLLAGSAAAARGGDENAPLNGGESFMSPVYDVVLKYFPMIIDDPDVSYTFTRLWNERKSIERRSRNKVRGAEPAAPPGPAGGPRTEGVPRAAQRQISDLALFRECVLRLYPCMHFDRVPRSDICNDINKKRERLELFHQFARRSPFETLCDCSSSTGGGGGDGKWTYKPFCASEMTYCMSDHTGFSI